MRVEGDAEKTVLLVEDEAIIALSEERILKRNGLRVVRTSRGDRAVAAVQEDPSIDLVLMDIDLGPGIAGTEAAQQILETRRLASVFLTNHAEREYVQRVQEITNYGYVLKTAGEFVLLESIRMAFSLFEANTRTELHAAEVEARERRLDHLNRVLRSIRNVNQLITRESERDALLSKACRMLVDTNGYHRAWVVLREEGTPPARVFHTGLEDTPFDVTHFLSAGGIPECARTAGETDDVVVVEDPAHRCGNCPLREDLVRAGCSSPEYATFAAPLAHGGTTYGWINVVIPGDYAHTEDEIELFREITGDLSYALFNMSMQTAGRAARAALEASEARHRMLYENAPLAYQSLNAAGEIIDVNPAWLTALGYTRDHVVGRHFTEFLHPLSRPHFLERFPEFQERGAVQNVHFRMLHRDGSVRDASFTGRIRYNDDGSVQRTFCVFEDITARLRAEDRLRETLKEREELMKELNHRVKNNLAMVASLISLKDDNLGERADLSDISNQIIAIRTVHEKLTEASDSLDVDLGSYLEEILAATFGMLPGRRVECTVSVPGISLPAKLVTSIGLIVNELATNAVKHAFQPGQDERFRVTVTELQGGRTGTASRYRMEISNSGTPFPTGIDPETTPTLGLHLISQLVAQLQGELELRREPETCFRIDFPAAPPP